MPFNGMDVPCIGIHPRIIRGISTLPTDLPSKRSSPVPPVREVFVNSHSSVWSPGERSTRARISCGSIGKW